MPAPAPGETLRGTSIQVHLIDLPQMLEDVVRAALDPEAVTFVEGPPGPAHEGGRTLVVAAHGPAPDAARWMDLWCRRPDVAVLVIELRDGDGMLCEVWPRRRILGELTEARILAAARAVVPWNERLPEECDKART